MNNLKEQNEIKFFKEITMEELEEKGFLSSNRNYKLEKWVCRSYLQNQISRRRSKKKPYF